MNRMRKERIQGNEVSQMYTFDLGGYAQKVLIEGKSKELPVVIWLHGGPGTPIPFNAGCRGLFPQFTDRFLMVYWDQLGCGINHCHLEENLKLESFVNMAADLICEVRDLFPRNRIYLLGVSWGSVLAAKTMEAAAGNLSGVLTWGQVTHNLLFNSCVKEALSGSRIPANDLRRIEEMEPAMLCGEDLQFLQKCLQKYTDAYFCSRGQKPPMGRMLLDLLTGPDYKLRDFLAIVKNGYSENRELQERLFKELIRLDLSHTLENAPIPYRMLQGETDLIATTAYAKDLADRSGNANLSCQVVENAGHFPTVEGMERLLDALTELTQAEDHGEACKTE